MAVDDCLQRLRDIGDGIDIIYFAGRDDRCEQRPVLRADFMAGEQGVFPCQSHRSDGVFDRVRIQFKTTILQESREAAPMAERIADIAGES